VATVARESLPALGSRGVGFAWEEPALELESGGWVPAPLALEIQGARFRVASALAGRIAASPRVCDLGSGYERRRTARLPSKIRPRV
jgi:hypothetical protein